MFGDYCIYCNTKVLGLICDDVVYIKPTKAGDALLPHATMASPYTGAKPHIVLEELEDREFLAQLVAATCSELPFPKVRQKKKKTE